MSAIKSSLASRPQLIRTSSAGTPAWSVPDAWSRAAVASAATAVTAAAAWKLFHAVPRAQLLFAGGLVAGTIILLVR